MITIKNMEEMKEYYVKEVNTYVFNDDVEFLFDVEVDAHIRAHNIEANDIRVHNINAWKIRARNIEAWGINAYQINAYDIKAYTLSIYDVNVNNIDAWDIKSHNIKANDINYLSVCYAANNIECNSIKGKLYNSKHFVFDGDLIVKGEKKPNAYNQKKRRNGKILY